MGYYADSSWDIQFHNLEARDACFAELGVESAELMLAECGEYANVNDESDLVVVGWTSGKWFSGGDEVVVMVAAHADGVIEFTSDEGPYRVVLRDGKAMWQDGVVIYPPKGALDTLRALVARAGTANQIDLLAIATLAGAVLNLDEEAAK